MNKGFHVTLTLLLPEKRVETYRNVTEIHYRYKQLTKNRVAFESDIHSTGHTWDLDQVDEFEAVMETEIADGF